MVAHDAIPADAQPGDLDGCPPECEPQGPARLDDVDQQPDLDPGHRPGHVLLLGHRWATQRGGHRRGPVQPGHAGDRHLHGLRHLRIRGHGTDH